MIISSTDGDPVDLDDEHKMEILKSLSRFAQKCRVDLGINEAAVNEEIFNATFEEISSAVQGKKDRSKYNFKENKNLGKGKIVLAVIKDYVDAHPGISFEELVIAFPPDKKFHTSYAIIAKVEEIEEKNHVRYYIKDTDRINLSDTSVAVCNQWGITNIGAFFDVCKKLGIEIK